MLSQEEMQAMVAAGGVGDKNAALAKQLELQRMLRHRQGPQGMATRGGYTAAHPLSHIADVMEKRGAQNQIGSLQNQMGQNQQAQEAARMKYIEAILRARGAGGQPPMPQGPGAVRPGMRYGAT